MFIDVAEPLAHGMVRGPHNNVYAPFGCSAISYRFAAVSLLSIYENGFSVKVKVIALAVPPL